MKLFIFTFAFVAICNADRLDRTYLPPAGANTAGGSDGALSAPSGLSGAHHHGPTASGPHSQAFRQQTQPLRSQSSSVTPSSQHNAFNGSPTNSNFGPSNGNYQQNNSPNARYPSKDRAGPSQDSAFQLGPNVPTNNNAGNFDNSNPNYPSGNTKPYSNYQAQSQRPQATQDANAAIIRSDSNIDGDGFSYSYETENGIRADESGIATNGVQAQGSYSYTGDDGQLYSITYTADENGYRPVGDHLPTPPPIPEAILRSIKENERAAAANPGANYDDYDNSNEYQSGNGFPIGSQDRQPARTFSGAPNQRTPAKYQQNEPNTQGYNSGRPSSTNNVNDQYNAPAGPGPVRPSGLIGSRPQAHSFQSAPQGSRNANQQGAPGLGGNRTPGGTSNGAAPHLGGRPSNQAVGGPANEQFGPRRPSASFSPSSGYKY